MVRCKFQLSSVTSFAHGTRKFVFTAVYDPAIPDDQRFAKSSPSGTFEIVVTNPAVNWQAGESYYFDVTPVPAPPEIEQIEAVPDRSISESVAPA